MARKPQNNSIYQIAREAGVSAATVSRAINNRVGVSEEVRAKVAALMAKYNFTPNYPSARRSRIAIMSVEEDQSGCLQRVLCGVLRYGRQHDLDVNLFFRYDDSGEKLVQRLRDQQCSGIIAWPGEEFCHLEKELEKIGLPVVALDVTLECEQLGYITSDSYAGACAVTRHLLELGHKKIGYLLHHGVQVRDHQQRFQGYLDTMKEAGITPAENWIIHGVSTNNDFSRGAAGLATMRQLLVQAPELTAVEAVDDAMALGAITAIHKSGRRIPDDLAITGFGNYSDTVNWFPSLTTVSQPIEESGYRAAEAIDQILKNPGTGTLPRITLPTQLIIRESTSKVK